MIVKKLQAYLNKLAKTRETHGALRVSALGHCARQLAYDYHGHKGQPLDWRAIMIFRVGDIIHKELREWLASALEGSDYSLERQEAEVKLWTPDGNLILGHIDGWLSTKVMALDDILLEVKSINARGFRLFKKVGRPDQGYSDQAGGYAKATGAKKVQFLLQNKDTSEIASALLDYDDAWDKRIEERLRVMDTIVASRNADEVPKEFGPDDKGKLDWHCGYCPHWKTCWKDRDPEEYERKKVRLNK